MTTKGEASSSNPSPPNIPFPPRKNDSDCWNCVGITFYSDFLRAQGKKPKCYGIEYVSGKQIEPTVMEYLETLPIIKKETSIWIIGLSQSSLRMHRTGQPPLRRRGFYILDYYDDADKAKNEKNSKYSGSVKSVDLNNEDQSFVPASSSSVGKDVTPFPTSSDTKADSPPISPSVQNTSKQHNNTFTAVSTQSTFFLVQGLRDFIGSYEKSCSRLSSSMGKIYAKSTVELPNRFEKSASKLLSSCNKLARKTANGVYSFIFGEDQSRPKN